MCTGALVLIVATLALIIAGIAYLVNRNYEQSFAKEMQDYIEEPKYKEMQNHIEKPRHMDKATNTEEAGELKPKEEPVLVVDNLIDFDEVQPSAAPLSEIKLKTGELYPWSDLKELDLLNRANRSRFDRPLTSAIQ